MMVMAAKSSRPQLVTLESERTELFLSAPPARRSAMM